MSLIRADKQIQTSSEIPAFRFQGNLLRGIDNWLGAVRSLVQRPKHLTTISLAIFLYFNLKKKSFYKHWPYVVSIQNYFLEKNRYKKDCNLEPF